MINFTLTRNSICRNSHSDMLGKYHLVNLLSFIMCCLFLEEQCRKNSSYTGNQLENGPSSFQCLRTKLCLSFELLNVRIRLAWGLNLKEAFKTLSITSFSVSAVYFVVFLVLFMI